MRARLSLTREANSGKPVDGRQGPGAGESPGEMPTVQRRGWFRRTLGGAGWLMAAPGAWFGAGAISDGGSAIGGLSAAARSRAKRDRRFKTADRGVFDLEATAFSYGVSVSALEARLAARRRQTMLLAYAFFGIGFVFLAGWLWSALMAPFTGGRLLAAIEFLPFCGVFFLMAFYNALINFQIRTGRTVSWREYLTTEEAFFPR